MGCRLDLYMDSYVVEWCLGEPMDGCVARWVVFVCNYERMCL